MRDYIELKRLIVKFIQENNISSYDLVRVSRDLCCCKTCRFFVQHYVKDGYAVDFGHCTKNNIPIEKKPNMQSCGFWTLDKEELSNDVESDG